LHHYEVQNGKSRMAAVRKALAQLPVRCTIYDEDNSKASQNMKADNPQQLL